jgi:hypothetical protein
MCVCVCVCVCDTRMHKRTYISKLLLASWLDHGVLVLGNPVPDRAMASARLALTTKSARVR